MITVRGPYRYISREEGRRRLLTEKMRDVPGVVAFVDSLSGAQPVSAFVRMVDTLTMLMQWAPVEEESISVVERGQLFGVLPVGFRLASQQFYRRRPWGQLVLIASSYDWPGLTIVATVK